MKAAGVSLFLIWVVCSWGWADDKRLVADYSFDQGVGTAARDDSGKGNDGEIYGAAFVKSPRGHALRFDGVDDFVDCGAGKNLQQLELAGTIELWVKPAEFQGGLVNWSNGSGGPDQRLVLAFKNREGEDTEFTHRAADGTDLGKHARQYDLDMPGKNVWNHVALTFDGGTITYHLDGRMRRVHYQQFARAVLEAIPLWIGRCQGLGKEFFQGTIDEVRIYNQALSDEEILAHFKEDAAAFGKDTTGFEKPGVRAEVFAEPGRIALEVDLELMRPLPKGSAIEAQVMDVHAKKTLLKKAERIWPSRVRGNVVLDARDLPPGKYLTRTSIVTTDGNPIGQTVDKTVSWPGQAEAFQGVKILNNLVWELLNLQPGSVQGERIYSFNSPKTRWLYVKVTADAQTGAIRLSVDQTPKAGDLIAFEAGEKGSKDAMCFLPAGECQIILQADGPCRIDSLVARSIPELYYHEFAGGPSPGEHSPDSIEFAEKHVIPHVNTFMIARGNLDSKRDIFQKYVPTHRRWLTNFVARGMDYFGESYAVSSLQELYDYLTGLPGYTHPDVDGVIGDEFLGGSDPGYKKYVDVIGMLEAEPRYQDRLFYGYCTDIYGGEGGRQFVQAVIDSGGNLVWERYLKTMSSESAARQYMWEHLVTSARNYREYCPGSIEKMTALLGYYTLPGGHLENSTPTVNFKSHLDVAFNMVANHPVFWGTYGLGGYHSEYGNEETIRWLIKLFRHYGIEGNSEPATDAPYMLTHIKNPDFFHGATGWTLDSAEEGSIRPVFERGFGWHQARVGRTEGDTSLLMVRNASRPNRFSQEIKDLQPGKLYVLYMFSGDRKDMSKKEQHAVRIQIENGTVVPAKSYTYLFSNGGGTNAYPPYTQEGSAWLNYHYQVFRAHGNTAKLVISDWVTDTEPGGPSGQELIVNFISVQPYFSEEE